jgi:hypothetical protein
MIDEPPFSVLDWRVSEAGSVCVHEVYGRCFGATSAAAIRLGSARASAPPDWFEPRTGGFAAVFVAAPDEGVVFGLGGEVRLIKAPAPQAPPVLSLPRIDSPLCIALVAHNPPSEQFQKQIASIRAQSMTDWRCVILDAASRPDAAQMVRAISAADPRFHLVRIEDNAGAPENFFRLLGSLPRSAFIALCDQDDCWLPEKLSRTVQALDDDDVHLAYCDMRVVTARGDLLSNTFWLRRRNAASDPMSLLLANTITGAASVVRGRLIDFAWPLPRTRGKTYHDHWLGLCALAIGKIAYVDAPLYDYVQHGAQEIGHRAPRTPPLARDLRALSSIARGRISRDSMMGRDGVLSPVVVEAQRIKHLALALVHRAAAIGSPIELAEVAAMAGFPHQAAIRRILWRRGLQRFARASETVGAEWRLLATAQMRA